MSMAENDSSLSGFLDTDIAAARKAGEAIRKGFYQTKHVVHKGQVDLVTETDKACEDIVFGLLKQHYTDHKFDPLFIGEETVAASGMFELTDEPTWILRLSHEQLVVQLLSQKLEDACFDPSGKDFDITTQRVAASNTHLKEAIIKSLREINC